MLKTNLVALILLMFLLFIACDDGSFPIDPENYGHVMVIHASPDAPGVDVYVEALDVENDLNYPDNTRYLHLEEESYNIALKVTGTDDVALETDLDVKGGEYHSVFACDAVAKLTALVIKDEYPTPDSTEAFLRFVHLSPDAPAVDVTLTDGTKLFESTSFKGSTPFSGVKPGIYDLQVRLAGTEDVVVELTNVKIIPRAAYTCWAKGFVNGSDGQELGGELIFNRIVL